MAVDPEGIVTFKSGKQDYSLFFGMRAMKAVETHYDKPFFRAIQDAMPALDAVDLADKKKVAEATANLRLSDVAKLFEFALHKHHPELAENDVEYLIDDLGLDRTTELLGQSLTAALGAEEAGDDAAPNPPKKSSRKSKTGSRS